MLFRSKKADRIHQAEKPVALIQKILGYVAQKGETVLDQFAGSGSTGEACLLSGLDSILIEKSREVIEKIAGRLCMDCILQPETA